MSTGCKWVVGLTRHREGCPPLYEGQDIGCHPPVKCGHRSATKIHTKEGMSGADEAADSEDVLALRVMPLAQIHVRPLLWTKTVVHKRSAGDAYSTAYDSRAHTPEEQSTWGIVL